MSKVKCAWYWKGYCNKGLPGTKCEVKGCIAKTEVVSYSIVAAQTGIENGYEQAKKDYALTWQDIKTIVEIADNIANQGIEKWVGYQDEYYKAVLEEFNKTRK